MGESPVGRQVGENTLNFHQHGSRKASAQAGIKPASDLSFLRWLMQREPDQKKL